MSKITVKEYRRRYRQQPHVQEKMRDDDLRKRYGINLKTYFEILERQGGGCAICKTKVTGVKNQKWFHVDHPHGEKRVRGILCKNCNTGLGLFGDIPELLIEAAKYLFSDEEMKDES